MKLRERVQEWENQRVKAEQAITDLTDRMDKLMDQLQDRPQLSRLQSEMTEMRTALEKAEASLEEAKTELATLKQQRQPPASGEDTPTPAPANGANSDAPPVRKSRGSRARATFF